MSTEKRSNDPAGQANRRNVCSSGFLAIVGCIVLSALATSGVSAQGSRKETVILYWPWKTDVGMTAVSSAKADGAFVKEGIDLQLQVGISEAEMISAVTSTPNAIGIIAASDFLRARAGGAPIVAFAAGTLESGAAFYVAPESRIRGPSDFAGKSVGYQIGGDTAAVYEIMMNRSRLSRSTIKEVQLAQDAQPFSQKEIDVWPGYIGRTSLQLLSASQPFRTIKPADFGAHLLGTVYFTSETTLQRHPDALRRFLGVLIDGWEATFGNYAQSLPRLMQSQAPTLDRAAAEALLDEQRQLVRPLGERVAEFGQARWTDTQNQLIQFRMLKKPVDLTGAVTYELLKDVYRRRVPR